MIKFIYLPDSDEKVIINFTKEENLTVFSFGYSKDTSLHLTIDQMQEIAREFVKRHPEKVSVSAIERETVSN